MGDFNCFLCIFFIFSKFSHLNLYYGYNQKIHAHFLSFNHVHHSAGSGSCLEVFSALLFSDDDI